MDLSKYIFKTKHITINPSTVNRIEIEEDEFLLSYKVFDEGLSSVSVDTVRVGHCIRFLEIKNSNPNYEHEIVLLIAGSK